jgi:hypothetical protein
MYPMCCICVPKDKTENFSIHFICPCICHCYVGLVLVPGVRKLGNLEKLMVTSCKQNLETMFMVYRSNGCFRILPSLFLFRTNIKKVMIYI